MFQLSLCVNGLSERSVCEYREKLKSEIIKNGGVFSIYEKGDFTYFLIVSNKDELRIIELVKDFIVMSIINFFKYDLIIKNLKYEFAKDIRYHTLVQALLNFDRTCDENFLKSKIDFSADEFYLDSFYFFKCKVMKEKWLQLIQITNQNAKLLDNEENYLEILKFLLDGIDKTPRVEIEANNDVFLVKSGSQNFSLGSYKSLMDFIIRSNPKELSIKNLDKKFVIFLKQLFPTSVIIL